MFSLCLFTCVYLLVFIYLCLFACVYLHCQVHQVHLCLHVLSSAPSSLAFTCVVKCTRFNHQVSNHVSYHTVSPLCPTSPLFYITLHTYHVVPQSEVSGNGDAIGLFRYVEDFILSILQGGADIRPVTTTTYLMREKGGWQEKKE